MRIGVIGCGGRMGRAVLREVLAAPDLELAGGVERPGHPDIGRDLGLLVGEAATGIVVRDDLADLLAAADAVIEFSTPEASLLHARACADRCRALVIGTTGFSPEQERELWQLGERLPLLVAPNMSLGVNLLLALTEQIARALGPEFDIEILEMHHRHKIDAPSGTALKLAEAIAQAAGQTAPRLVHGRQGLSPRQPGEIGVHAVRAGGIVGEHTILFASEGEEVALVHRAYSRQTFAEGALRAARFLADKPPGLYSMLDVLAG